MSDARTDSRTVTRLPAGEDVDLVAVEEPLEIRVEGAPVAVTMRTPGDDLDLAAGFLFTEGVIDGPDDLVALAPVGDSGNVVDCVLAGGVAAHRDALRRATRELYANSSCGICGKTSIDRIHVGSPRLVDPWHPPLRELPELPERLRASQVAFAATGGLHAAGLFDRGGALTRCREDIGRHNAVDKVLGSRLREGSVPVDDRILVVSSRAGFEIVQKALVARVSCVVAVGAASTLAIDLARASGIMLVGFARDGRAVRYA